MSGLQAFYRQHPEAADLYEAAMRSEVELKRIEADVARFRVVDMSRLVRAVDRFVVEPAAIELASGKGRWFEVYGKRVRAEVAERVARVVVG